MYEQIEANKRNSILLVFFFFLFLVGFGVLLSLALGGNFWFNFILFTAVALIITAVQYHFADKEILSIAGARPANKKQHPVFVNAVEGLAIAAGLPVPKMYVINSSALNAFAKPTRKRKSKATGVKSTGSVPD